jgi:hypothetical protein
MRWLFRILSLGLLAPILGGCVGSPWAEPEGRREAEQAKNVFPTNSKSDVIAFMRTYLNDPTNVRSASISSPESKPVQGSPRFVACIRYNAKGSNGQYLGLKDSLAIFISGKLDRVVELGRSDSGDEEAERSKSVREICSAAVYQPFPELERLTR